MSDDDTALGAMFGQQDGSAGSGKGFKYGFLSAAGKASYDRTYNIAVNENQLKAIQASNDLNRAQQESHNQAREREQERYNQDRYREQERQDQINDALRLVAEDNKKLEEKNSKIYSFIDKNFRKYQNKISELILQIDNEDKLDFNSSSETLLFGMLIENNDIETWNLSIPFLDFKEINDLIKNCAKIYARFENDYNTNPVDYFKTVSELSTIAESQLLKSLNTLLIDNATSEATTYFFPSCRRIKTFMKSKASSYGDFIHNWDTEKGTQKISYFKVPISSDIEFSRLVHSAIKKYGLFIKDLLSKEDINLFASLEDEKIERIEIILDLLGSKKSNIKKIEVITQYPSNMIEILKDYFGLIIILYREKEEFAACGFKGLTAGRFEFDYKYYRSFIKQNIDEFKVNKKYNFNSFKPSKWMVDNIMSKISLMLNGQQSANSGDKLQIFQDLPGIPLFSYINSRMFYDRLYKEGRETYTVLKDVKSTNVFIDLVKYIGVGIFLYIILPIIEEVLTKFGWIDFNESISILVFIMITGTLMVLMFKSANSKKTPKPMKMVKQKCKKLWNKILTEQIKADANNDSEIEKMKQLKMKFSKK